MFYNIKRNNYRSKLYLFDQILLVFSDLKLIQVYRTKLYHNIPRNQNRSSMPYYTIFIFWLMTLFLFRREDFLSTAI